MADKSYEYKLIIEKAKKITNRRREEFSGGFDDLEQNRSVLKQLHKDINILQHNNTFSTEHQEAAGVAKRQFRKAAKRVVSAALLPAMQRQTLYNENATQSLLNLTIVSQNLFGNAFRNRSAANSRLNNLRNGMDSVLEKMEHMEQRIESLKLADRAQSTGGRLAFAQAGEDIIIDFILQCLGKEYPEVSYVDIGANHAKQLSNTYFAYQRGGHGVLAEANPALIPELRTEREGDAVVNCIVGEQTGGTQKLFVMSGDGLSTTSLDDARSMCEANPAIFIESEAEVKVIGINELIANYLQKAPTILSIDTEGSEYALLSKLDFAKYRPLVIITELIEYGTGLMHSSKREDIAELLKGLGYEEFAFTGINGIFVDVEAARA